MSVSSEATFEENLKLLFFLPDGWPTFRPDVATLFGKHMSKMGITSDLITHLSAPNKAANTWPGGHIFGSPKGGNKIVSTLRQGSINIGALLKARRREYTAVQVRDEAIFSLFGLAAARLAGKPYFYWMSFPYPESRLEIARAGPSQLGWLRYLNLQFTGRIGQRILYDYVLPRADHVFVQSTKMLSDLVELGVKVDKMTAVPMGYEPSDFPAPNPRSSTQGSVKLVYLGTCEPVRRIDFLFEVLKLLLDRDLDCELLIVGDASENHDKIWLRQCVIDHQVEHAVTITGWLPQPEARARVANADIGLALMAPNSILNSTSPTKLVEYLASGLPVVANSHPDQEAVLRESGAGFVTAFVAKDYADAIAELVDAPDLRKQMGQRGRQYVHATRSYENIAQLVAQTYTRCLNNHYLAEGLKRSFESA